MKLLPALVMIAFLLLSTPVKGESDFVLDALVDEMARSVKDLHVDQHPPPYFVSYNVKEVNEIDYSSCLGSKPVVNQTHDRIVTPIVKIGQYDLDSAYHHSNHPDTSYPLPIDDDYTALRRAIWMVTDHEYKSAIRVFEWKKAYLSANNVQDRLPDMSHEEPVVSLNPVEHLDTNKKWLETIQNLSDLFKNYPTLQKSKVSFITRAINTWYVNSEGSRVRDHNVKVSLRIWAEAQAPDGMPVSDFDIFACTDEAQLPDYDVLKKATEDLAQRVSGLQMTKKGEEYCGPVLFEGQAAAQLISQIIAANFGFAEEYIGTEDWRNPLKNALGRKILPKHMTVIDNPQAKDSRGNLLYGTYKFDDEGMPGNKITLVENGTLKGFCQSRIPTRHNAHSNGHSMGGHGVYSVLELASSQTSTPEQIKTQLFELAKDAGLDYVIVVSRMNDDYQMTEYPSSEHRDKRSFATPSYSNQPSNPSIAYKLYVADGRRELIRGLEFRNVSLRAFRDIQAVGNDAKPFIVEPQDGTARSLVTPSYVIGEMELTPVTPDHSTPPIVPGPLVPTASPGF